MTRKLLPLLMLLSLLPARPAVGAEGSLNIADWLGRPGVRVVALDFYATWCHACMQAVPKWKKLEEAYGNEGLRLLVVDTQDPGGACHPIGWTPDQEVCDFDGHVAQAFGAATQLPAVFVWSWQGKLLVNHGDVGEAATAIRRYLDHSPRVVVAAFGSSGREDASLDALVKSQLAQVGKLVVVAGAAERHLLHELQKDSYHPTHADSQQCQLGEEVSANSRLEARVIGRGRGARLVLSLFSVERGCLVTSAWSRWRPREPSGSVAEAVSGLLGNLTEPPVMPGGGAVPPPALETPAGPSSESIGPSGASWSPNAPAPVLVDFTSEPPGAVVLLDGNLVCKATPCQKAIATGAHLVEMQAEQYLPRSEDVTVTQASKVSWKLKPNFATVEVSAPKDGIQVSVDGNPAETTPLAPLHLSPGVHQILVDDRCYQKTGERLRVRRGETRKVELKLAVQPAGLTVLAEDQEGNDVAAVVLVDGKKVGKTPGTFKVGVCAKKLEVRTAKLGSWTHDLDLKARKTTRLVAKLGPSASVVAAAASGEASPGAPGAGYVSIPAGTFTMGSPADEPGRFDDETQHSVTISKSFYMEATDVTQGEWTSLMGNNPSNFSSCGSECPVEQVSWWDAVAYANALSAKEGLQQCYTLSGCSGTPGDGSYSCTGVTFVGLSCTGYRLPTEAEWEYAARAGTTGGTYNGTDPNGGDTCNEPDAVLDPIAWFCGNSGNTTHAVKGKQPNAWGLYDMLGNVWQWVWDWYGTYPTGATTDPTGPTTGSGRVGRGGSWGDGAQGARAACRLNFDPGVRRRDLGFRLVRSNP